MADRSSYANSAHTATISQAWRTDQIQIENLGGKTLPLLDET